MKEYVVLVDRQDKQIGLMEKLEAHRGRGILHRAISVFLWRKKNRNIEMLFQQRCKKKPLWPLYWSNTVCTHPRNKESYEDCAVRRLQEELGVNMKKNDLHCMFRILYQARYSVQFGEYELDSVFVGQWDGQLVVNKNEVEDVKWARWKDIKKDVITHPGLYTPWFKKAMKDRQLATSFRA